MNNVHIFLPGVEVYVRVVSMMEKVKEMVASFGNKNKKHTNLKFISEHNGDWVVKNLAGNGLVNCVYLVQTTDGKHSAVLKHIAEEPADEMFRGKKFNLPIERALLEYNCLKAVHEVCPGSVPQPYAYDPDFHIIAMEYLEGMDVIVPSLVVGDVSVELATQIGKVLGCFHYRTHRDIIDKESWKQLEQALKSDVTSETFVKGRVDRFTNYDGKETMIALCDELVFYDLQQKLNDEGVFEAVRKIFTDRRCLVHADFHSLAIFASSQRTAVFDFEFGGLGHPAYSLGMIMSMYYMSMFDTRNRKTWGAKCTLIKQALRAMVDAFLAEFQEDVDILNEEENFMSSVVAIFGFYVFTWPLYIFFPHFTKVEDKSILVAFMRKGYQLMKEHQHVTALDQLFDNIFNETLK